MTPDPPAPSDAKAPRRTGLNLPAWFTNGPLGGGRAPTRRRLSLRRHGPAALAVLIVAAGIALLRPGDLRPGSAGSGPAADPPARSATAGAGTVVATLSAATIPSETVPSAPVPTGAPALTVSPVATESERPAPDVAAGVPESLPASVRPRTLPTAGRLASSVARRRAQTWDTPAPPWTLEGYVWPLPHGRITDPFGPSPWGSRIVDGRLFHDGIDVATYCGDRVVAAHRGVVLAAGRRFDKTIGWLGDLGPYIARLDEKQLWGTLPITVVIDDGNGYRSIYAHFYRVVVKPGQRVRAGQFLGYEGATGRASGCHLHYGLFAAHETATFAIEPAVVKRMLLPPAEVARIDPLLVLPRRAIDGGLPPAAAPGSPHGLGE